MFVALLVALSLTPAMAWAQHPLEPADTSSPRATLTSFLDSAHEIYESIHAEQQDRTHAREHEHEVKRLLRCLDLSQQPEYRRAAVAREAAVCLKEVLDRIELPLLEDIPDAAAVAVTPDNSGLARWTIPHTEIDLVKVAEGPRQGEFLFSAETVDRAADFYERVEHLPYRSDHHPPSEGFYNWFLSEPGSPWLAAVVHSLPSWVDLRIGGQAVWQWVGMVLTVIGGLALMFLAYRIGRSRAVQARTASVPRYCLTVAFPLAAMFVPLLVRNFITHHLVISGDTLALVEFSANLVFLMALLVVLISAANRIAEVIVASPRINPTGLDAQFIRLVARILGLVAAAIVFLEGGQYLGIPLTTLLAGAGVGGLTIALAAQDTLKNIFGSMMIILDKPFSTGERIVVKGYDGVVEEIGLRSTRIRLLTGHMASIPNEEMARADIENVGRRPYIRRVTDLHVPLNTPREKLELAVEMIRKILANHEGMPEDRPPRVFFNEFNPESFNIRIMYWYAPPEIWNFLALADRVNFEICRAFEKESIDFSLPHRVTHVDLDNRHPFELRQTKTED